jgi:sporulation protein YlmC with PRC-barrel domain
VQAIPAPGAVVMNVFATELTGKTVMTEDGEILGILQDFMMDTRTGKMRSMLIQPSEQVEVRLFQTDPQGRILLNFESMRAVKDVIVVKAKETE